MKYIETNTSMNHTWFSISSIFFCRYPNPYSEHVLSEDVISRKVEDNILKTVRLHSKINNAPNWLKPLLPSSTAYIVEESHIDIRTGIIMTYTKNLNLKRMLQVDEKTFFLKSPDGSTKVIRRAWIRSNVFGLAHAFESFGLKRYKSNIVKTEKSYDYALRTRDPQQRIPHLSFNLAELSNKTTSPI